MYLLYRKTFCNICFCTVYKTYRLLILNLNWWNKQHYTPAQRIQFSSSLTNTPILLKRVAVRDALQDNNTIEIKHRERLRKKTTLMMVTSFIQYFRKLAFAVFKNSCIN